MLPSARARFISESFMACPGQYPPASSWFSAVILPPTGRQIKRFRTLHVNVEPIAAIFDLSQDHLLSLGVCLDDEMVAIMQAAPFSHLLRYHDPVSTRQGCNHLISIALLPILGQPL